MHHGAGEHSIDFALGSHLDREVRLRDLRGRPVVLVFFPLAWTPV
jgi:peroxiredoxin